MTPSQSLVLLTLLVVALGGVLLVTVVRLVGRMRQRSRMPASSEPAFMADALHEAVSRLRTQERVQQARAEASERLNADIVANLVSGLIVVRADGTIGSLNPSAATLLGVREADVDRPFDAVFGSLPDVAGVIAEGLRTGHPTVRRSVDLRSVGSRPGTAVMLDVSVSPLFRADGLFEGAICLFTDTSAVVELEEQLRLREGLARLGELAAGIAHEFRNGLATIHGYARLIPLDELAAPVQSHVRSIQRETEALGGVVTRFLEFARPAPLSVARIVVRDLLDSAVGEVRPAVADAHGTLECAGACPDMEGDPVLLQRALVNVLHNALEACARVPVRPRLELLCEPTTAPDGTLLRVLDNGRGFTRDTEARAFEPFFTTRPNGTGLGLALVRKFVVLHGGRISLRNRESAGAEVSIWLPRHPR